MEWFMGPTGMFINQLVWIMNVYVHVHVLYMYLHVHSVCV